MNPNTLKNIKYLTESVPLYVLYTLFRIMPVDMASATGAALAKAIGPHLKKSKYALKNLKDILPELTESEHKDILIETWDNLGRVMAEYPHLEKIGKERVTFTNKAMLLKLCKKKTPSIIIGGHMGNWETPGPAAFLQLNLLPDMVYRKPNNPFSDRLLNKSRTLKDRLNTIPKSKAGARQIIQALKKNHNVCILIDQKYNEGEMFDFIGKPAMTSPAFVQLAQKFKCPLIILRTQRLKGVHFQIDSEEIQVFDEHNNPRPIEDVVKTAHDYLENCIREKPGQWLWSHRRWPKEESHTAENKLNA